MRLLALLVVALLAGCASPDPGRGPPDVRQTGEQVLEPGGFFLPPFGGPTALHARLSFTVREGHPIDVFAASRASCEAWGTRSFTPYVSGLDMANGSIETDVPKGDHCFAFDNAGFAFGKAEPVGTVTIEFVVEFWEIP